jgi:hypothetical protein
MQRIILRVIVAFIACFLLLFGLLALALPRLINSDQFRITLREHVAEMSGASVEWQSIEARLLPPRLMISAPVLTAMNGNPDGVRLSAESADLRFALLPIFARRLEIDSLVLRGVDLIVTRTSEGFLLPHAQKPVVPAPSSQDAPTMTKETPQKGALQVDLRRFAISDGRIIVRDRLRPRPVEWRFEELAFEATRGSADEPLAIEFDAEIAFGAIQVGRVKSTGFVNSTGPYDVDLRIDELSFHTPGLDLTGGLILQVSPAVDGSSSFVADLDLASAGRVNIAGELTRGAIREVNAEIKAFDLAISRSFLPDSRMELAGLATGKVRVVGEVASPDRISLELRVESGLLRMPDYLVEGPFLANLKVESPMSDRPRGHFDLDLTAATLEFQGQFKKPAGKSAEMATDFTRDESGEIVFESRLKLRDINEILLHGASNDSASVDIKTSRSTAQG